MNEMMVDPESLLPQFGLSDFRPGQRQVIDRLAAGDDVLCVMPTGGGKSLCYQLPALARPGTTLVVSPLIALMKDQVDGLKAQGIAAELINSTLTPAQQEQVMAAMAAGEYKLVYIAPERLRNGRFLEALGSAQVTLLAVDEAHCVSEWGHDFRPDYARLGQVRKRYLPSVQTIALTATATPMVRDDVCQLLQLDDPKVFVTGFARTNLRFGVTQCKTDSDKQEALVRYIATQQGAGIIYAATRKACEEIGHLLPGLTKRKVGVYHGGMDSEHRRQVQEQFMGGDLDAIVATNAFGMGIDKSNIRYVAHYNMPGTLEAYYQEAGRAGRDGGDSDCRMFFAYQDRYIQGFFIENRYPSKEVVKEVYEFLLSRPEDPIELTLEQVRRAIDADSTEAIGTAETLLSKAGVLRRLDSSSNQMILRIDHEHPDVVSFLPKSSKLRRRVLGVIQELVGKRRFDDVYVRPQRLMDKAELSREQLSRVLRELKSVQCFDYVPPFRGRAVHVVRRDLKFHQLDIDFEELARRKAAEFAKLDAVIGFARSGGCRQKVILDYFGDPAASDCKRCDRCVPEEASSTGTALWKKELSERQVDNLFRGLRVILSGITRMHGRFGISLVAQMLCGSNNKKVMQWKLNRLSTYGLLSGLKQSQLSKIITTMIEHGLVVQKEVDQRRPTVEISELGKSVMHLQTPLPNSFLLPRPLAYGLAAAAAHIESGDVSTAERPAEDVSDPEQRQVVQPTVTDTSSPAVEQSSPTLDSIQQDQADPNADDADKGVVNVTLEALISPEQQLLTEVRDALKRWRRRASAAHGLPAFRVLSNATIDRLAELRPKASSELEVIKGIGPATLEQFGYDILEVIQKVVEQQGDEAAASSSPPPELQPPEQPSANEQPLDQPSANEPSANEPPPDQPSAAEALTSEALPAETPFAAVDEAVLEAVQQPDAAVETDSELGDDDQAYWTWRLFSEGYQLEEVVQVRRLTVQQVFDHLRAAEASGRDVQSHWRR